MYIEFQLPDGSNGMSAVHANYIIDQALQQWSTCYNILYNTKNIKYFKRVTFDNDAYYAFFAVTWNPDKKIYALSNWRIVLDPNNKNKFNFSN
jgi:hypothetical protein